MDFDSTRFELVFSVCFEIRRHLNSLNRTSLCHDDILFFFSSFFLVVTYFCFYFWCLKKQISNCLIYGFLDRKFLSNTSHSFFFVLFACHAFSQKVFLLTEYFTAMPCICDWTMKWENKNLNFSKMFTEKKNCNWLNEYWLTFLAR